MMKLEFSAHGHGDFAMQNNFPNELNSLVNRLGAVETPLRPATPFDMKDRGAIPKRQKRERRGVELYQPLPVDQPELNNRIEKTLRDDGWGTQPVATGPIGGLAAQSRLKGDFVRNSVFVEVEFGNNASLYRDFFKFQVAYSSGAGKVAVLVAATDRFAKLFDSGVTTFETANRMLPYLRFGFQMPLMLIGIEPENYDTVRERYDEMYKVCLENGVGCHSYEIATSVRSRRTVK